MDCTGLPTTFVYDWPWGPLSAEAKDDSTVADEDRFTEYQYDATQQTQKTVLDSLNSPLSTLNYSYNLQGRMATVTIDSNGDALADTRLEYEYNDHGIRTAQTKTTDGNADGDFDDPEDSTERTDYLVDEQNPTGYAQVLEEWVDGTLAKTYTIGPDVFAEAAAAATVRRLLKDGHGSTRFLVDALGQPLSAQIYRYDAYGNAIGFDPATALTTLLYNAEQFDSLTGLTFLRARYYDLSSGRFTRHDPFFGNLNDPQSLHKYLFTHGDPINFIDSTGLFTQALGYAAEAAIQAVYARDHPADVVIYGRWTRLGLPGGPAFRLKPDIFNTTTKRWAEIKPLSPSGTGKAVAQFAVYSMALAPFGYLPDVSWTPSTHFAVAGVVPIVFFNAGGIIFYTDAIDSAQDLIVITSIAAARDFLASGAARRLALSAVEAFGQRIPALAGLRVSGDSARLETHVSIGGLLGAMGFV